MGQVLTRILDGPVPHDDYDVKKYQVALRKRRRIIFGTLSATSFAVGIVVSGSVIIGIFTSLLPAVPLWFGNKEAWQDVQPEFLNNEWKECVDSIHKTIEKLDQKHVVEYSFKYPLFVNLPLLCIYHSHNYNHHSNALFLEESESTENLNLAFRYMRFASSAYGAVYMRFLKIISDLPFSPQRDLDTEAICQHTGIFKEDVISVKLTGLKVTCPCHFIAIDRATKSIVVTVRGTANLADVITDLVCESVSFLGGFAHDGIKRGAERLFEETLGTVCSLLDKYPKYCLVVTGHSLGAGTSILLTMLYLAFQRGDLDAIRQDLPNKLGDCVLPKNVVIKCYAFAPPPVFSSPSLPHGDLSAAIEVFVNNRDIVPRLSLATFNDMLHVLQRVDTLKLGMKERLKAALSDHDHPILINLINMIKSAVEDTAFADVLASNDDHFIRLQIPGKIHWMQRKPNKNYRVLRKGSDFFKRMVFVDGFFADHLPDQYEQAFDNICQNDGN